MIQIWSAEGSKRPDAVYRHAHILRRQQEKKCTRFYVEELANEEKTSLTWAKFRRN